MKDEKPVAVDSRNDPWFPVLLSYFVSGLGQVASGKPVAGAIFFALQAVAVLGGTYYCLNYKITSFHFDLLKMFVYLVSVSSMFHAFFSSRKRLKAGVPPPFYNKRNPFFSTFISLIVPGLGQAYNGSLLAGIAFIAAFYMSAYLFYTVILGFIFMPLVQVLAAVHAYEDAYKKNGDSLVYPKLSRFVFTAAVMGIILFHVIPWDEGVKKYYFETGIQDSAEMEPALGKFNFVYLDKAYYGVRLEEFNWEIVKGKEISRGDVLCFKVPKNETVTSVLRCIGLPGDKLEIRNKKIMINGKELPEPYAVFSDKNVIPADKKKKGVFGERDNMELLEIPVGMYFMMGDNRDAAVDSRTLGFIPRENITGKAEKIEVGKVLQDAMKIVQEMSESKKNDKARKENEKTQEKNK